jgi:DNA-binding CsgD family transcriptional regulator
VNISTLSALEKRVLDLLVTGATTKAIAAETGLSRFEIANLLRSMFNRLGRHSRTALAVWYFDERRRQARDHLAA